MLRIFMIEWWDGELCKYNQEYYKSLHTVAKRVKFLDTVYKDHNVEVSTIVVDMEE